MSASVDELDVTPTKDLIDALNRRFDLFFGVSFQAEPHREDSAIQYWGTVSMDLVAPLVQYALAHHNLNTLREFVLQHRHGEDT